MSATIVTTRSPEQSLAPVTSRPASLFWVVGTATGLAVAGGLLLPDRTVGGDMSGMSMTHYMGLLAINQPWNLLLFMAIPVILAETLAVTELVLLFRTDPPAWVHTLSRVAGLVVGPLMLGIGVHLLRYAVGPLTTTGGWRGAADVIAVFAYLASALPLIGITLVELGIVGRDRRDARKWHAIFVGTFLVIAHVAMIFGMLDPTVLGWDPTHVMPGGTTMPGMEH